MDNLLILLLKSKDCIRDPRRQRLKSFGKFDFFPDILLALIGSPYPIQYNNPLGTFAPMQAIASIFFSR